MKAADKRVTKRIPPKAPISDAPDEITALKQRLAQSEASLHALQSELQQLTRHAGHAVRIINRDYTIHYINQSFANMSGIATAEAIGQKCWEVFPGPFCHTPECRLARILNGETLIQAEIERTRCDGTRIPCIVNAVPFYSDTKDILGVIESFTDITEKKQLKQQAEESEERYRALIELGTEAGEAIVMLQDIDGQEGIQTFVSDQWLQITGYSKEELLGSCFFDLIDPKDRASSIERHQRKMSGMAVPGLYTMSIKHKNGNFIPIEVTGAFTTYQGKKANVLYIRNITERILASQRLEESENRYRSLFENVPVAIWESDCSERKKYLDKLRTKGIINFKQYFEEHPDDLYSWIFLTSPIKANNSVFTLFEAESITDKDLEKSIQKLLIKGDGKTSPLVKAICELANGASRIGYDSYNQTLKGNWKHMHIEHCIAPGHEATWDRIFIVFFDITSRVQAEEELKHYQKHLEEIVCQRTAQLSHEIKRREQAELKLERLYKKEQKLYQQVKKQLNDRVEFTRALVHELKTPLTPMVAASSAMVSGIQEEPWKSMAEQVHKGANNLSRRINNLLDLSKSESGLLHLNFETVNPTLLLYDLHEYFSPEAARLGLSLVLDIPEQLPSIWADPERLRQVVINLLDNALKFTPKQGQIKISAGVRNSDLEISVQDTGIGMTIKEQRRIFSPYKRSEHDRNRLSGLGLGLALAKTLVEQHGGKIWIQSQKGRGSTFTFSIPLNRNLKQAIQK
jgi:PAS domain S-box-containing protein